MKAIHFLGFIRCAVISAMLLGAVTTAAQAANEPVIVVNNIPQLSRGGALEGRVVWNGLTTGNFGQYAVVAMLHATWGDDYVKPSYVNYLNAVDPQGFFSINIATDVNDEAVDVVYIYFVERSRFLNPDGSLLNGEEVKSNTIAGKFIGQPLIVSRTAWWNNRINSIEKEKNTMFWILTALALGVFALVFIVLYFMLKRRYMKKEALLLSINSALDAEYLVRKKLGQDLHDRLGSILTAVIHNLVNRDVARNLLKDAMEEMRRLIIETMPSSLYEYGLKSAVEDFCVRLLPTVQFCQSGSDLRYVSKIEISLYLAAIELINNAVKHSSAERIDVIMTQDAHSISITVQDNGCGFDPRIAARGNGLSNARSRIASIGGMMALSSQAGVGTKITLEINGINEVALKA